MGDGRKQQGPVWVQVGTQATCPTPLPSAPNHTNLPPQGGVHDPHVAKKQRLREMEALTVTQRPSGRAGTQPASLLLRAQCPCWGSRGALLELSRQDEAKKSPVPDLNPTPHPFSQASLTQAVLGTCREEGYQQTPCCHYLLVCLALALGAQPGPWLHLPEATGSPSSTRPLCTPLPGLAVSLQASQGSPTLTYLLPPSLPLHCISWTQP